MLLFAFLFIFATGTDLGLMLFLMFLIANTFAELSGWKEGVRQTARCSENRAYCRGVEQSPRDAFVTEQFRPAAL